MDLVASYQDLTDAIQAATGMSRPMLHVQAGMAIYLLGQVLLGTRRGSLLALLVVAEAAVFNEIMNRLYYGSWRWADTSQDLALTLFWPSMCFAVSKYRRWLWNVRRRRTRDAHDVLYRPAAEPAPARAPSGETANRS